MKICFPVEEPKELNSSVYGHFGSAPTFLVVDTDTGESKLIANEAPKHTKGMCSPLKALSGHDIHGVIVGGIGKTALVKLNAQGIIVYRASAETVRENLDLLSERRLPIFSLSEVCAGHGHGCSH